MEQTKLLTIEQQELCVKSVITVGILNSFDLKILNVYNSYFLTISFRLQTV